MITINQKAIMKMAEAEFKAYKEHLKNNLNCEFKETDEAVAKGIFVNGFIHGIDAVRKLGNN